MILVKSNNIKFGTLRIYVSKYSQQDGAAIHYHDDGLTIPQYDIWKTGSVDNVDMVTNSIISGIRYINDSC